MQPAAARALFATARVARLASVTSDGRPHVVPIVFALQADTIHCAVDHKPKRTQRLRRLANIAGDPRVSVLVDHYDEDWSSLWWVRADGIARIVEPDRPEHEQSVLLLAARYSQYTGRPPAGPAIVIEVARWSGWRGQG